MSPLGGRSRLAAALVAALAMVTGPLLVTVPVRGAPIDCTITFSLVVFGDLVIGPGDPGAPETDHRSVAFRGLTPSSDPCPGDGYFDASQIEETHGSVTLANVVGETSGSSATVELSRPPTNTVEGRVLINTNRYKDPSVLGRAVFTLWVSDGNDHWISATYAFYVRREVRFTDLNAGPEPVRKGARITVSGHLARLAYNRLGQARWIPYPGKSVDIYRRPKGTSWMRFHTVASTTTTSTGYFIRRFTATGDSCWSAFSLETDDLYARELASKWGDCVDVQ